MKFRVWSEKDEEYYSSGDIIIVDDSKILPEFASINEEGELVFIYLPSYMENYIFIKDEKNEFLVEFSTGLKDINEEEIYVGDIVNVLYDAFDGEQEDRIYVKGLNCIDIDRLYHHNYDGNSIEIIGNIHENPELLSK